MRHGTYKPQNRVICRKKEKEELLKCSPCSLAHSFADITQHSDCTPSMSRPPLRPCHCHQVAAHRIRHRRAAGSIEPSGGLDTDLLYTSTTTSNLGIHHHRSIRSSVVGLSLLHANMHQLAVRIDEPVRFDRYRRLFHQRQIIPTRSTWNAVRHVACPITIRVDARVVGEVISAGIGPPTMFAPAVFVIFHALTPPSAALTALFSRQLL